jgi:hypothetical protein
VIFQRWKRTDAGVPVWRDVWGVEVRVTEERLGHIHLHRELIGHEDLVQLTLAEPDFVVSSAQDSSVRIYDRHFADSPVGDKHLWAVVKWSPQDAFLLSAYFADRRRKGTQLWP